PTPLQLQVRRVYTLSGSPTTGHILTVFTHLESHERVLLHKKMYNYSQFFSQVKIFRYFLSGAVVT
ncbi:hypothetical protein ACWAVM_001941, partial [Vibrio cholerae]